MKKTISIVAVAAMAAAGVAVTQPAAAAKKYTACSKKSSGEMRLLQGKKKKCPKGWKKITWTKSGPTGSKGPQGGTGQTNSFGTVVDGNGQVVGEALSVVAFGVPTPFFLVRLDGGAYTYLGNGWLYTQVVPNFDNASCTGAGFIEESDALQASFLQNDTTFRAVFRAFAPTLGPARAWKATGQSTQVVAAPSWRLNESGDCVADAAFSGYRVGLTEVPAPPDRPGPLRLS